MSYIHAENLVKEYGTGDAAVTAIGGMSFTIQMGEFVAVMGESGSGKSTLLTMMGALNTPTAGNYSVDGLEVYELGQDQRADFRREFLGFVFQSFHLVPYLTLLENVMLPLATVKTSSKRKRALAEDALLRVGLNGKSHRLPGQTSNKLRLARTLTLHHVDKGLPRTVLADATGGRASPRAGLH